MNHGWRNTVSAAEKDRCSRGNARKRIFSKTREDTVEGDLWELDLSAGEPIDLSSLLFFSPLPACLSWESIMYQFSLRHLTAWNKHLFNIVDAVLFSFLLLYSPTLNKNTPHCSAALLLTSCHMISLCVWRLYFSRKIILAPFHSLSPNKLSHGQGIYTS